MGGTTTREGRGSAQSAVFIRNWEFGKTSYSPKHIKDLKKQWPFIPDEKLKGIICADEQFILFHRFLARELRSKGNLPGYDTLEELNLSLRAGMIRTEVFMLGGIAEAALYSHAVALGLPLSKKKRETFGPLLKIWFDRRKADIEPIFEEMTELKKARNTIHLDNALKAADSDGDIFWRSVIKNEDKTAKAGDVVLKFLKTFQPKG